MDITDAALLSIVVLLGLLLHGINVMRADQRTLLKILDRREATREPSVAEIWSDLERQERLDSSITEGVRRAYLDVTRASNAMDAGIVRDDEGRFAPDPEKGSKPWDF